MSSFKNDKLISSNVSVGLKVESSKTPRFYRQPINKNKQKR